MDAERLKKAAKAGKRVSDCSGPCPHDYTADELEFMKAMRTYMKYYDRKFPTFVEVLVVLKELGYRKQS